MLRLLAVLAIPAFVVTGCGPASTVLAEDIGYDSLKTSANTPALVRGQRPVIGGDTIIVNPGYGGRRGDLYRR